MVGRGTLVVFEGCDRAGKTTQCKMLVESLNKMNINAEFLNFPERSTPIGKVINDYLTKKLELPDKAVHLLFSANRWELEPTIRMKIESGVSLVVDRYSFSGAAFSAAKKNMDLTWCWNPEIGLPKPDAVFLLNLSDECVRKRSGFGSERYEVAEFQEKVWANFRLIGDSTWQDINADQSIADLHSELLGRFLDVHKEIKDSPLHNFFDHPQKSQ